MKLLLLACLLGFSLAEVEVVESYEPITLHYHENIGIPEAAAIKAAEEATDFDGSRIVGGSNANLGQYPHMGGLVITLTTGATSVCGSSLISTNRAVTAAHCWWDNHSLARQFVVVLGSVTLFSGGTRITTTDVRLHPNYNPNNLNNDVAIITIRPIVYGNIIRNIPLAAGNDTFADSWGWAAGFGRQSDSAAITNTQRLHRVNLQVIANAECRTTFGSSIIASTLCTSGANGRSTCGGDSGGPLEANLSGQRVLIGIASFVAAAGCQLEFPAVFARVTSFQEWLRS